MLTHYVIPYLGTVLLARLGPDHVHRMLRSLERDRKSARSRQYARVILRRALNHAERWELTTRNAARLVEGPRTSRVRLDDILTAKQANAVLAAAGGDRLEALAVIVLRLGLRKGGALALRWSDIDLDAGELRVSGTLKRRRNGAGLNFDTPKTKSAARTLPLIGGVATALRAHGARQAQERLAVGPSWGDADLVFTTPLGTPIDPRNINRWWDRLCRQAGVGHRRFRASRHTAVILLLDAGVPLEVVSAILGHASLAVTADIYAKVTQDAKRRALRAVEHNADPEPEQGSGAR
ncbi:MAG: site-specific integrase [Dehalococcoidia bacterium]